MAVNRVPAQRTFGLAAETDIRRPAGNAWVETPFLSTMGYKRPGRIVLGSLLTVFLFLCLSTAAQAEKFLRIATTTSTHNSGLMDYLLPHFKKKYGYHIDLKVVGTGKALQLAREGLVGVVIVHARPAEDRFMESGYGLIRRDLMHNDFVVIGPADDPAGLRKTPSVMESFKAIERAGVEFVSRADDSGTNRKELAIWEEAGMEPYGDWYFESGKGMAAVLKITAQKKAYTLIDRGTWLAREVKDNLKILFEGDPLLHNPYGVIVVRPQEGKDIDAKGGEVFLDWITSSETKALIDAFKVNGEQLFFSVAD